MNLVAQSYGSNYKFNSSVNKLYFGFFKETLNANGYITWNTTSKCFNNNKLSGIFISVNSHADAYGSLENGGNPDGKMKDKDTFYLDRVLAHEMTHAVMMINIDSFNDLPQFIKEGTAELVHGIDDDRKPLIEYLANNPDALKNSLDIFDHGTGNTTMYAGGYMFLRWLAKQGAEHYSSSNLSVSKQ